MSNENVLFQVEDEELETTAQEDEGADSRKYLIFTVDDLKIGIDAEQVVELLNGYMATYLPMMPDYILGIFNMRGQIIPIVDIRSRLGKMPIDYGDNNCIIVLEIDSISLGILVDSVSQVVDSELSKISPVPVNKQQELVNGMISLDANNVVLLLDCEQLVNEQMMM